MNGLVHRFLESGMRGSLERDGLLEIRDDPADVDAATAQASQRARRFAGGIGSGRKDDDAGRPCFLA